MSLASDFIEQSRGYLAREYPTKIQKCLETLPAEALWARSDSASNSIGNLLLHLEGNVRQWIVSSVGGAQYHRRRAAEFDAREGGNAAELFARLRSTLDEVDAVLTRLSEADLVSRRTIQDRDVTVFD